MRASITTFLPTMSASGGQTGRCGKKISHGSHPRQAPCDEREKQATSPDKMRRIHVAYAVESSYHMTNRRAAMDQSRQAAQLVRNVKRSSHLNLRGAGQAYAAVKYAYVGHVTNEEGLGTRILGVSDPNRRVVQGARAAQLPQRRALTRPRDRLAAAGVSWPSRPRP